MRAADASHASAEDISEADYDDVAEASVSQDEAAPDAPDAQWQPQRHTSCHAGLPFGMPAVDANVAQASRQTREDTYSRLHPVHTVPHASQPTVTVSRHVSQPADVFQPMENMRQADAASWGTVAGAGGQQQGLPAANLGLADRYQHATVLGSPDEFTWQPIRPQHGRDQSLLAASQSRPGSSAGADQFAGASDACMAHLAPKMQGHRQGSSHARSLRQSLDAAARLDERLQAAQQMNTSHAQAYYHHQQGQNDRPVSQTVGSSSSWHDLQDAYASVQMAHPAEAGQHHDHDQQQQQQQHMSTGCQSQSLSHNSVPRGPVLMDRSRPQTAAGAPSVHSHLDQSLSGFQAAYNADTHSDKGHLHNMLSDSRHVAQDKAGAAEPGSNAMAQQGRAQRVNDNWLGAAGHDILSVTEQARGLPASANDSAQAVADVPASDTGMERPYQVCCRPVGVCVCMCVCVSDQSSQ